MPSAIDAAGSHGWPRAGIPITFCQEYMRIFIAIAITLAFQSCRENNSLEEEFKYSCVQSVLVANVLSKEFRKDSTHNGPNWLESDIVSCNPSQYTLHYNLYFDDPQTEDDIQKARERILPLLGSGFTIETNLSEPTTLEISLSNDLPTKLTMSDSRGG